jgi:tetratricopeptide (TPR) repeat protein
VNEEALRERLGAAWRMPYGRGQIAAVEEVIRHADAQGLAELRFAARMLGTSAYTFGGEPAKAFMTFSWCLATYDRGESDHDYDHDLFWHFKWIVNALTNFPEVPLDRTYAALDDMERRYRVAGHSLNPVHQYRTVVARHVGDKETAAEQYRLWGAAPRGEMSDCIGCEPTSKVRYLNWLGEDEAAVALALPVLGGQLTCWEQPHSILTQLLVPYLRTERLEEAASAHRQAYRAVQGNRAKLAAVGDHIAFCAYTGNAVRGLELLERHIGWLEDAPDPMSDMHFSASCALVLRVLAEAGHGELEISETTVEALHDKLSRRALDLAEGFDVRNGTSEQGDEIRALLAASPIVDHLPLSGPARAVKEPEPVSTPDLPSSPEELAELAQREARLRNHAIAGEIWKRFDELCPDPPPALLAQRLNARAGDLAPSDPEAAEAAWRRSAELFAEVGNEVQRQVALSRLSLLHCYLGKTEDGLAGVTAAAATLAELGTPDDHARGLARLAVAYGLAGRRDEAMATLERAESIATDPALRAEIAVDIADNTGSMAAVERAIELYSTLEPGDGLRIAQNVAARIAAAQGDLDRASALLDEAALTADRGLRGQALQARGQIAMELGEGEDAYRDLSSAVTDFLSRDALVQAAHANVDLTAAALASDLPAEAADAAEEAITVLDRTGHTDAAARARFLLARAYRELGQQEQAVELLDLVITHCRSAENHAGVGQMQSLAGDILDQLDQDEDAAIRFAAAADAYAEVEVPGTVLENRRRSAISWHWAGNAERSVATLTEAEELAAQLSDSDDPALVWEKAMLAYDGARILTAAERQADALSRITSAAALFRILDADTEAAMADVLQARLQLNDGRSDEAERLLTAALETLPSEATGPREDITQLLDYIRA